MLGILERFWKLERGNDSQISAVKRNNRDQQEQNLRCSLVDTSALRKDPGLEKLKQVFKNYVSRSDECPFVTESAMDTSDVPPRSQRMQGCECGLKSSSSMGGSNQGFD